MMARYRLGLVALTAWMLAASPVAAVPLYKLAGNVLANGGNGGTGGGRVMLGTLGQFGIGVNGSPSWTLCSGFWCFGGSRVVAVDDGGGGGLPGSKLPTELAFGAPSPNPSRGDVRFTLALPQDAEVTFSVLDVAGRQLGGAVIEHMNAGYHQLHWSAPSDHSGVYFGVLRVDGALKAERRIVLVR